MRKLEDMFEGATFKDFLFRPQEGIVSSRTKELIDLSMPLSRNIILRGAPVVSANMRTVTGARMGKAMPDLGCCGIIHRRYSKEVQAQKIIEIKRSQSYIIENPLVIHQGATLGEARELLRIKRISGLLIEEKPGTGILAGILSHKDIFGPDSDLVSEHMTCCPSKVIFAGPDVSMEEAEKMMHDNRKEKLPILGDGRKILGLITMRDLKRAKQKPHATLDSKGRLLTGAAIGASGDYMERARLLVDAGVDVLLIDIAHGHSEVMRLAIKNVRTEFPDIELIAGNIATYEGAKFLMEQGVDAIKVGVGPGRGCRTRLDVRFGVPQLQAIREAYLAVEGRIPIIADGGIEDDGDIIMALFCGASTVMLGSMLAGADESPGLVENGMKMYKGETSIEATLEDLNDDENLEELMDDVQAPEGQPQPVKYTGGSVSKVVKRIRGHLKSAVSYAGTRTLFDAHKKISEQPMLYMNRKSLSPSAKKESFDR